jgi:hypothetical protein
VKSTFIADQINLGAGSEPEIVNWFNMDRNRSPVYSIITSQNTMMNVK